MPMINLPASAQSNPVSVSASQGISQLSPAQESKFSAALQWVSNAPRYFISNNRTLLCNAGIVLGTVGNALSGSMTSQRGGILSLLGSFTTLLASQQTTNHPHDVANTLSIKLLAIVDNIKKLDFYAIQQDPIQLALMRDYFLERHELNTAEELKDAFIEGLNAGTLNQRAGQLHSILRDQSWEHFAKDPQLKEILLIAQEAMA